MTLCVCLPADDVFDECWPVFVKVFVEVFGGGQCVLGYPAISALSVFARISCAVDRALGDRRLSLSFS